MSPNTISLTRAHIYYDIEKSLAIRAGLVDVIPWVACQGEWRARVKCQHGWREYSASVGKMGGFLAWVAWVEY